MGGQMRRFFLLFGLAVLVFGAIVVGRALRFTSKQVAVDPIVPADIDREGAANRLAGALRYPTISHEDGDFDAEAFLGLHGYLEERFPLVHATLRRETVSDYSLLYTWEGSEVERPPVLLLSHLDVVPVDPGSAGAWTHPPFEGRIAEDFIWGRGAMDDKIGVLAILEAVETLLRSGFRPAATVLLAFGHDEEVGGPHGAKEIAARLAELGVRPAFVLDEGGAIVRGVPRLPAQVAVVGMAEKGSVSLALTVRDEGGHSSAPPPQTAVGVVSAAVHRTESRPMPAALRGITRQFFEYVGPEMPFSYRLVLANLWLFSPIVERELTKSPATSAILRTTTAATMIGGGVKQNVLPTSARAVVNFRVLPGDSIEDVISHVRRVVDDPRVDITAFDGGQEATSGSPVTAPSFALLQRTIREVFPGTIVAPYLTIGGTDSRHYMHLTDNVYRFLPIVAEQNDLARVHGTDERVSLDNYERAVQFYLRLLENAATGTGSGAGGAAG
jgi:carboxypeptidase PM20D1